MSKYIILDKDNLSGSYGNHTITYKEYLTESDISKYSKYINYTDYWHESTRPIKYADYLKDQEEEDRQEKIKFRNERLDKVIKRLDNEN